MNKMSEPNIIINGQQVTSAMSMTIRVAIENFAVDLDDGRMHSKIGEAYKERIQEIRTLMHKPEKENKDDT